MFDRFTDRSRRVVVLAQEEARLLHHNYVGTEHILLGLVHETEGVAARALDLLGVTLDDVRTRVQEIIGVGPVAPAGHIPFTPRAKAVLELSLREALQLGHNHIGTEHILLGLLREGEGVAGQVLVALGADLERVRAVVIGLLDGEPAEARATPAEWSGVEQRSVVVSRAGGPRPAACSFCGIPSPQSGQLFAGSDTALICVRCAQAILAQTGAPAGGTVSVVMGTSTTRPFGGTPQPPDLDELVARVVVTGPPPEDEAAARAEIEHAALHIDDRVEGGAGFAYVRDADDLVPFRDEANRRHASYASRAEEMIDAIAFVSATEAVVWRSATLDGRPIPHVRHREGGAVLVDGRWLMTRATMVDRLSVAGIFVPPRDGDPPAPESSA